ncbi:uncharacterized protein Dsimw501_GD28008 [Drosophila simulans]|uniref:Uncharacterized protein n=1 Tax=Drosophila simulans TaxID=7240 RepID=A0A0J9R4Z8_DROSI|nr:uncharacterized protein Dsimw501_GD28008 [Drosophila simulans]
MDNGHLFGFRLGFGWRMQRRDYTHIRSVTNARVAPAILLTIIFGNLLCRVAGMVANVLGQHGLDGDKPPGQVTLVHALIIKVNT